MPLITVYVLQVCSSGTHTFIYGTYTTYIYVHLFNWNFFPRFQGLRVNTYNSVIFEVLTAVVMNVAIFCDILPRNQYVNRRFVLPGHPLRAYFVAILIFDAEDGGSSETSVHIPTARRYISEDVNIHI
jgi:hypothetical protein